MKKFFSKLLCSCSDDHQQIQSNRQSQREVIIEPIIISNHYSYNSQIFNCSTLQIFLSQISLRDLELILNNKNTTLILQQQVEKYFTIEQNKQSFIHQNNFEQIVNHTENKNHYNDKSTYPNELAEYIAQRFEQCDVLLEINSNYNQQSIYFSKAGLFVIAACADQEKIKLGLSNIKIQNEQKFIDLVYLNTDQLKLQLEIFDGIYINLCSRNIESDIQLQNSLINILSKNENVIILTDQKKGNFVQHFAETFIFVEKQKIFINNIYEYTIYYFGKFCNLKQLNLIEIIKNAFPSCKFQQFNLKTSIQEILIELLKVYSQNSIMKVFLDSLRIINSLEELFSQFLKELEEKQMITKERILQIHMRSSTSWSMSKVQNHPSSVNQILAESYKSKKSNISFNMGMYTPQQLSQIDDSLSSSEKFSEL